MLFHCFFPTELQVCKDIVLYKDGDGILCYSLGKGEPIETVCFKLNNDDTELLLGKRRRKTFTENSLCISHTNKHQKILK